MATNVGLEKTDRVATSERQRVEDFLAKWGPGGKCYRLNERQGAQPHFIDLCSVLGVEPPNDVEAYCFERGFRGIVGGRGFADVWRRGCFAWEYKAPGGDLRAALLQLIQYALPLDNPPLLVVSDRLRIEIHTHFTGHPSETHTIDIEDLRSQEIRNTLKAIFNSPGSFRPDQSNRQITEQAAASFAGIAERMRRNGIRPKDAAHFLTQCVFCLFAEGVGLLRDNVFRRVLHDPSPEAVRLKLAHLFEVMQTGGLYGADDIEWFNGGLFKAIAVPPLGLDDTFELANAASLNWRSIDPSIFGTLFERGLDPDKRSQLGAHYTDPGTIGRLVEPTVKRPLLYEWEQTKPQIAAALSRRDYLRTRAKGIPSTSPKLLERFARVRSQANDAQRTAQQLFAGFLDHLRSFIVLDPACGSGNFLYVALKCIKDVEHLVNMEAEELGLQRQLPVTGPHNVRGIEINPFAAELARVTIWIGELQWLIDHGRDCEKNPILRPLDEIEQRDAILGPHGSAASWPEASVIVGNPPFLGNKKIAGELGSEYVSALRKAYMGRVPGGADLVCYWFEKAREAVVAKGVGAAGLVATNSIRGGVNRAVLDHIVRETRIFDAWSDEPWINEGAAVRVSLVAFGRATQPATLNGGPVGQIASDLTPGGGEGSVDLTKVAMLPENRDACFMGITKVGPFDISSKMAHQWLKLPNPSGATNADVLRPSWNGIDVTRRSREVWIIDFGSDLSEKQAARYEAPFEYALKTIKPFRQSNNREAYRTYWWRHGESRPGLRKLLAKIPRYIVTPEVAKHRVFVWVPSDVLPDKNLQCFPRADDCTFGILQSRMHVIWSLRLGSSLEDRPRYTPTSCFETFPFPDGLTPADTASLSTAQTSSGTLIPADLSKPKMNVAHQIGNAARELDGLRKNWLNPPEWRTLALIDELRDRTLTNLYNRAPRWLLDAQAALDMAVAQGYGWSDYNASMPDDEVLRRLLAINQQRAGLLL